MICIDNEVLFGCSNKQEEGAEGVDVWERERQCRNWCGNLR
jgi:hypothetical protein